MHPNHALLETFYAALARRDGDAMAACYAPDVEFSDPVFRALRNTEPGDMWRMLCSRAREFSVEYRVIAADEARGSAAWRAQYLFSKTGRRVDNRIRSTFEFAHGLIARQRDDFDLWRWSRMALGVKGVLLGWMPPVQNAIRNEAARGLAAFRQARPR